MTSITGQVTLIKWGSNGKVTQQEGMEQDGAFPGGVDGGSPGFPKVSSATAAPAREVCG